MLILYKISMGQPAGSKKLTNMCIYNEMINEPHCECDKTNIVAFVPSED